MSEYVAETPSCHEGVSVQEYVDILRREGKVDVPSPDGKGVYTIWMQHGGYYVPMLTWNSYIRDEFDRYSPSRLKSNAGREILWYPKGLGVNYAQDAAGMYKDTESYFLAMGKMIIGFILAGRQLYTLKCGNNINSLNTNENHNYRPSY